MSTVVWSVLLGLLVNECSDVSPWLALRLMRWATWMRYQRQPDRLAVRLQELDSLIHERPGKLLKLLLAVQFVGAAISVRTLDGVAHRRRRWLRMLTPHPVEPLNWSVVMGLLVNTSFDSPTAPNALVSTFGAAAGVAIMWWWIRRHELEKRVARMVEENIVSPNEAELVSASGAWQRWGRGAKPPVSRTVRAPVNQLRAALLALASERAFLETLQTKSDKDDIEDIRTKRLDNLLREASFARSWLNEAMLRPV